MPRRKCGKARGALSELRLFSLSGDAAPLSLAVRNGVESLRVSVNWAALQPYRSLADVPAALRSQFVDVGGVPTLFAGLDRLAATAAAHGLSLLPVIENTPSWDVQRPGNPASPPRSLSPFRDFLTALVHRYGPRGTYWAAHSGTPATAIRMWQIWNEPHFAGHWSVQPFAPSYVALLAAAQAALKAADPGAQVVLAGLADFSWRYLEEIYRVPGTRRLFDVVAALVSGQGTTPVRRGDDRERASTANRRATATPGREPGVAPSSGLLLVHVDG